MAYGCWQDAFEARIIAVVGDLSQPNLGLNDALGLNCLKLSMLYIIMEHTLILFAL